MEKTILDKPAVCSICGKILTPVIPGQPCELSTDCGGDCWECVDKVEHLLDNP
jgi:hypothetical protein